MSYRAAPQRCHGPALDGNIEQPSCLMHIGRVEDGAYLARHHRALVKLGDIPLGVVLQVELAALPRYPGKHRLAGRLQARMVVAGNELDPA